MQCATLISTLTQTLTLTLTSIPARVMRVVLSEFAAPASAMHCSAQGSPLSARFGGVTRTSTSQLCWEQMTSRMMSVLGSLGWLLSDHDISGGAARTVINREQPTDCTHGVLCCSVSGGGQGRFVPVLRVWTRRDLRRNLHMRCVATPSTRDMSKRSERPGERPDNERWPYGERAMQCSLWCRCVTSSADPMWVCTSSGAACVWCYLLFHELARS